MIFFSKFNKYISKPFFIGLLLLINAVYLSGLSERIANIESRFGGEENLRCSEEDIKRLMHSSVVRIEGSLGEGSGFPISEDEIITNFHVIDGEASPKVVFADGSFETPKKILGSKGADIAVLTLGKKLTALPFYGFLGTSSVKADPSFGEPVYSAGYALGSDLPGDVTVKKGSFGGKRFSKDYAMNLISTDISLNEGMSGGPLVNSCGQVIGINTAGVAGLSLFLDIESVQNQMVLISEEEVAKFEIDTTTPEGVVKAFYVYISARDLRKAYDLVSAEKMGGRIFEDWTQGYSQTLHSSLISAKADEDDGNKVNIKLESQDWVEGELITRYYEGYWVVNADLKLHQSQINTVQEPSWDWFYNNELQP